MAWVILFYVENFLWYDMIHNLFSSVALNRFLFTENQSYSNTGFPPNLCNFQFDQSNFFCRVGTLKQNSFHVFKKLRLHGA